MNTDGTLDEAFHPDALGTGVASLAVQMDGRVVIAGQFTNVAGQARLNLARLNADGTLDRSFDPRLGGGASVVYAVALQADGMVIVGGDFTNLVGQTCNGVGRLTNTASAAVILRFTNSTLTWMRGGTGPEVWRTTFEYITNGGAWSASVAGVRIFNGWDLTSVSVPPGAVIRARGHVASVGYSTSAGLVESTIGAPIVLMSPTSRTNDAGTLATFTALAIGSPFSYLWRKNGNALTDGGNILGARTLTLKIQAPSCKPTRSLCHSAPTIHSCASVGDDALHVGECA